MTCARSLPFVGFELGVACSEAGGEYGVGDAEDPLLPPTAVLVAASVYRTGRKVSLAAASMRSIVALSGLPGMETTMLFVPWC